ncbi:MAG: MaoC family dehydratase [Opitutae bacterium]|nr:MaoC family dehydratase [Opitutae bacterium]
MLTWEDLQPGQKFGTAEYEMTAAEIVAFARQYDPQPFHTDPEAAKGSLFGEHVASGWHTAAVSMRLMVQGEMQVEGGVIGHVVEELRFPRPVRPGDRLRVAQEVVAKSEMPGRPTHGRLTLRSRTYNQDGKTVQHMTSQLVIQRRRETTVDGESAGG